MMRALTQEDPLYYGRTQQSFFYEGKFLRIDKAVHALEQNQTGRIPDMVHKFNYAQRYCKEMLDLCASLPAKQFPVARLKHVTTEDGFRGILREAKIDGARRNFLLQGVVTPMRVSCWSVHIPPKKVQAYSRRRFAQFMQLLNESPISYNFPPEEDAEVQGMLANSPAMRGDSRYGNFQFSFSTKELLAMYQNQHCGGKKPVLRVLGTEAYKQELVHWILVHSPAYGNFNHLPTVDPPGPFSRDGNLTWEPESMTSQFTYQISNSFLDKKPTTCSNNRWIQTYDAWIWSNTVIAFHLPQERALTIDRRSLLTNVQACETAQSLTGVARHNFLRHPPENYASEEQAQAVIDAMKWERGI